MHEEALAAFFKGTISATELARDVDGSTKRVGEIGFAIEIEDMKDELGVTSEMAIALCDAVIGGELPADALETIGFALMASDKFFWDSDEDEVLAEVIPDWSAPEVNYPLTLENVKKFRAWLSRAEPYPTKSGFTGPGKLISIKEKKSVRYS
jgi:hypothetical protein